MNGNELANILRYGGEEWQAGQRLPEEWWKTDFPYSQAELMGYRMSPEEIRGRQGPRRGGAKSLSDELADILRRPEVKMLDPLQRANLIETIQKAQAAIAKRKEEREKHEAEMLTMGKETQLRERVQAILQSDRVPAQKVTALTMAGVPLSDARDMVWGKRAPEAEERPTREAAPRARAAPTGEELVEGLRPEKRGVQFRTIGGELIKEPAGIWEEEKLTPEQEIAKREAGLKTAEYYRTLAVKRERPELFVPLEERKFELEQKETLSRLNLDWEKFGHTKDTAFETAKLAREKFLLEVKKHGFEVAKQKVSDEQWWAEFGLKDRESQEAAVLATKEFALEIEKFGLEKALKRHGMEMKAGELKLDIKKEENVMTKWEEKKKQWTKEFGAVEATRMFDQKMRGLEYEFDVEDAER